jgi:hypothetical protein
MPSTLPASDPASPPRHTPAVPAGGEEPVVHKQIQRDLHRYPPKCDFTLLANPTSWDIFLTEDGPEILPALRTLAHQPGVGGVHQVRDAETRAIYGDPDGAISHARKQGWVVVPRTIQVIAFGDTFTGYVHSYVGQKGRIHLMRWCRLFKVGTGSQVTRDGEGYHAFLRRVRDEILGAPHPGIVAGLQSKLRRLHAKRAARGRNDPAAERDAEMLASKLDAFNRRARPRQPAAEPEEG